MTPGCAPRAWGGLWCPRVASPPTTTPCHPNQAPCAPSATGPLHRLFLRLAHRLPSISMVSLSLESVCTFPSPGGLPRLPSHSAVPSAAPNGRQIYGLLKPAHVCLERKLQAHRSAWSISRGEHGVLQGSVGARGEGLGAGRASHGLTLPGATLSWVPGTFVCLRSLTGVSPFSEATIQLERAKPISLWP